MIYSIGTSNRSIDEFMAPLIARNVRCAIDVRSRPYSRLHWCNQSRLISHLSRRKMEYVWLGNLLGGDVNPETDMRSIKRGIQQVLDHATFGSVAYFCAEGDPARCHRSRLVGRVLLETYGVVTENILRDNSIEDIDTTLCRALPLGGG